MARWFRHGTFTQQLSLVPAGTNGKDVAPMHQKDLCNEEVQVKGKVNRASQESTGGCSSRSSRP